MSFLFLNTTGGVSSFPAHIFFVFAVDPQLNGAFLSSDAYICFCLSQSCHLLT